MAGPDPAEDVALGFRVKTGQPVAVPLAGSVKAPRVVMRRDLARPIHEPPTANAANADLDGVACSVSILAT